MSVFRDDLLTGKVALVTGGATGLGKEIARALGQHGAPLCIASRKQENLEAACHELQSEGLDCMWVGCDIRPALLACPTYQSKHGRTLAWVPSVLESSSLSGCRSRSGVFFSVVLLFSCLSSLPLCLVLLVSCGLFGSGLGPGSSRSSPV